MDQVRTNLFCRLGGPIDCCGEVVPVPATLKRNAVNLLALSIAFCVFFYASKHDPALNRNVPFAEDPYDAVGSFAIQFALFSSALTLVRAFRMYPAGVDIPSQRQLVAAGQSTGCMAVIVTLLVDLLALSRHPELWARSATSPLLLAIMAGLLAWAAISFAFGFRDAEKSGTRDLWLGALPRFIGTITIVAFYPERFRHTLFGAIATVMVGALVLFVSLRGFALAIAPDLVASVSTFGGDVLSVGQSFRAYLRGERGNEDMVAGVSSMPPVSPTWLTAGWLWVGICFCGVLIGCGLAGAELRESSSALLGRRLLIVAVYAGLETAAVLLGFALLRRPLRLSVT